MKNREAFQPSNDESKFAFVLPEGVAEGDHVMEFQIPFSAADKLGNIALASEVKLSEDA